MERDEAAAALAEKYRIRVALELRHRGHAAMVEGATMADDAVEGAQALAALVAEMYPRLLARLLLVEEPAD